MSEIIGLSLTLQPSQPLLRILNLSNTRVSVYLGRKDYSACSKYIPNLTDFDCNYGIRTVIKKHRFLGATGLLGAKLEPARRLTYEGF